MRRDPGNQRTAARQWLQSRSQGSRGVDKDESGRGEPKRLPDLPIQAILHVVLYLSLVNRTPSYSHVPSQKSVRYFHFFGRMYLDPARYQSISEVLIHHCEARICIMAQPVSDAIDFFQIDEDITLRRMVLRNSNPKRTVLFLHGFPETLYAWKDIAKALADDCEVHAFDWPGYGLSSRPTVDRFSYAPRTTKRQLQRFRIPALC